MKIEWMDEPEEHDFDAAASYLSLHYLEVTAKSIAMSLERAPMTSFKAKDIFRCSGLPELDESNKHVEKNLEKIADGKKLSPILLVRTGKNVIIADGYHRVCAVHIHDEDAEIPCKIV